MFNETEFNRLTALIIENPASAELGQIYDLLEALPLTTQQQGALFSAIALWAKADLLKEVEKQADNLLYWVRQSAKSA